MTTRTTTVLIATLLLAEFSIAGAAPTAASSALATPDQDAVEVLALKLLRTTAVQQAEAGTLRRLQADRIAASPDGKATARQAAQELAFSASLIAANSDSTNPKLVWAFTAPRDWRGRHVPGSRFGIDNPDNVYRIAPVDGTSGYEITVHASRPGPAQFSFLVYDSFLGEDGHIKSLDAPIAGLRDVDLKPEADGSYRITIDSQPANGRTNHIQTNASARALLVRNTFSDWATQGTQRIDIRRTTGPAAAAPQPLEALAVKAARFLHAATDTLLSIANGPFASSQSNSFSKPFLRGGGWGIASSGRFSLAGDEALVVTLDPLGAQYLGFDLTSPWLVSREHVHATGSLNNHQAQPNADGSYTYVVAARDPGVANWVSTGGLHQGQILIRWQVLPSAAVSADKAIRDYQVVKLSALPGTSAGSLQKINPAERRELNAQRALAYAHRYQPGKVASSAVAAAVGG